MLKSTTIKFDDKKIIDENLDKDKCTVTAIATNFNDNIFPNIGDIKNESNNKDSDFEFNYSANEELKENTDTENILSSNSEISEKIMRIKKSAFDYTDDNVVDKLDSEPAYIRQQLSINFNNSGTNSFLDPRID